MSRYCGIDLHATNSYVVVIDEEDEPIFSRRLPNDLLRIVEALEPHREELEGIAVESTCNWYWLVDALVEADYRVHLVHTSAVPQYEGLKFSDDRHDARWLAHLLRLGLLPTGYIYPKEERAVRDLLRKRCRLVQQRTANLLSIQNLVARTTSQHIRGNALKRLSLEQLADSISDPDILLAIDSTLVVVAALDEQIQRVSKVARARGRLKPEFRVLRSIPGVGETLGLTIMYETGSIDRFPAVGNFASYCRCVRSQRTSNARRKGAGNRKNGNPYLSWAFTEAAHFARRFQPQARRFYDRKLAKTHPVVALRALAHKLARASYFMLRDQTLYDPALLFR